MTDDSWDSIADWYVERLAAGSAMHDFNRDVLLAQLPDRLSGQRVLDLGCGEGIVARALAARGASVLGIDPSPRMIEHARATQVDAGTVAYAVDDGRRVVGDYLTEGFWRSGNPEGARRAGNQHRTMATYLNALFRQGFTADAVAEPAPTEALVASQPQRAGLPPFLVVRAADSAQRRSASSRSVPSDAAVAASSS